MVTTDKSGTPYEYVVVGSGAGGGTVAARLAEQGHRVLLLEAGGDPRTMQGADPASNGENRMPADYDVPAFHALASENEATSWDFFVRHYSDDALQQKDPKYREVVDGQRVDGVLYPRAATLGGCTAHNAMILVYPHNEDWREIEQLTGDSSWSPASMRRYFQKLEDCHHRPLMRWIHKLLRINLTRHGFSGWLRTEIEVPKAVVGDQKLKHFLYDTVVGEIEGIGGNIFQRLAARIKRLRWTFLGRGDPNDWRLVEQNSTGLRLLPLATKNHARMGSRERVLDVQKRFPDKLVIELDALVTRVLFDDQNRATGVEYLKGARLYRAHKKASNAAGELRTATATREVILSGGTYNSPQLLMLSGIGPREQLEQHGIPVRVDLPGVGANLQDRYEIGIVNRMNFKEWTVLKGAKFAPDDPLFKEWERTRTGVYATNGAVAAIFRRSFAARALPDIFCFALLGPFQGYYPGYSAEFSKHLNYLTWAILKAHTRNTAGYVRLRSADPRDTPEINFRYFAEGNDKDGEDLQSVVEAIHYIRRIEQPLVDCNLIAEEMCPGKDVQTDEQLADYVRNQAWGHHAAGTCAIGTVVNGNFEVLGTKGLRVVDASIFPKIPGFFIVSSVYTIGEKAADVISAAAR